MAQKNPFGRRVTLELAYEVWKSPNGDFTTFVLRKNKSPEQEAQDPYASWYVATQSPGTMGSYDYGDTYAAEVKRNMILVDNPFCSYLCVAPATKEQLLALGIPAYHQTSLMVRSKPLCFRIKGRARRTASSPNQFVGSTRPIKDNRKEIVCQICCLMK